MYAEAGSVLSRRGYACVEAAASVEAGGASVEPGSTSIGTGRSACMLRACAC